MDTTRLVETKQGQVVRIPEKYRPPGEEVYIERVGDSIVLHPKFHGPVDEPRQQIPDALMRDLTEGDGVPARHSHPQDDGEAELILNVPDG